MRRSLFVPRSSLLAARPSLLAPRSLLLSCLRYAVVAGIAAVGAQRAAATGCGTWPPALNTYPMPDHESKAVNVVFNVAAPPGACDSGSGTDSHWDGTDHLRVVRIEGSTPATTPSGGTFYADVSAASTNYADFMHRSNQEYSYTLFACEDSTCTSWYGDGGGSDEAVSGTTDSAATDYEK